MEIINYIAHGLGTHLTGSIIDYYPERIPKGILFLERDTPPRPNYICIASREAVLDALDGGTSFQDVCLMLTAGSGPAEKLPALPGTACFLTDLDFIPLYNLLQNILRRMGTAISFSSSGSAESFADFLHDVITMETMHPDEIENRLHYYPRVNNLPFRVYVFEFDKPLKTTQNEGLFDELQRLFPWSNSTWYFDRVITLAQIHSMDRDRISLPEQTMDVLQAICERYRALCGMSNHSVNWAILRTNYLHAKAAIRVGAKMRKDPKQRVFTQEEFFDYLLIEMCFREFTRIHHHSNYTYTLHPGIHSVIRYDKTHNSNLREVLCQYLRNDRNLSKTAASLYIHRNTALYKVNKAIELLEDSIEDPLVRHRLLWSCTMCEYCERVLGLAPEDLVHEGYKEPE